MVVWEMAALRRVDTTCVVLGGADFSQGNVVGSG